MKKAGYKILALGFALSLALLAAQPVLAVTPEGTVGQGQGGAKQGEQEFTLTLENPIAPSVDNKAQTVSPNKIIGAAIKAILGIIGSISLLIFVVAGLIWMTSRGNDDKIKKSRDAIMWAALGMLAVFASYVVLNYALNFFSEGVFQTSTTEQL